LSRRSQRSRSCSHPGQLVPSEAPRRGRDVIVGDVVQSGGRLGPDPACLPVSWPGATDSPGSERVVGGGGPGFEGVVGGGGPGSEGVVGGGGSLTGGGHRSES